MVLFGLGIRLFSLILCQISSAKYLTIIPKAHNSGKYMYNVYRKIKVFSLNYCIESFHNFNIAQHLKSKTNERAHVTLVALPRGPNKNKGPCDTAKILHQKHDCFSKILLPVSHVTILLEICILY